MSDGRDGAEAIDLPLELLERLWTAFTERHPRYLDRFAHRYRRMKVFGAPLVAHHRRKSVPKVGRNAPCPCGSGKKYKKCCGR